jgi:hypothetical protein
MQDLSEIDSACDEYRRSYSFDFKFDDIDIGRIAPYEAMLKFKISDLDNLSPLMKNEFKAGAKNCMKIARALSKVFSKIKYDNIVVYNLNYGTSQVAKVIADRNYARTIHFHYSFELSRWSENFFLIDDFPHIGLQNRISYFEKNQNRLLIPFNEVKRVFDHIKTIQDANMPWVYSERRSTTLEALDKLSLKVSDKIVLLSLSSMDEFMAVETCVTQGMLTANATHLFGNQIEWVKSMLRFFTTNPEWKLIIRIHPREFPNKRDSVLSQAALAYRKILKNLPPNIIVNGPDQKVSIYDLFGFVDLHLTSWSTVGLESALFGIPTISITKGLSLYPTNYVNSFFTSENDYFNEIRNVLEHPRRRSYEIYGRARNWLLFDFVNSAVQFRNPRWHQTPIPKLVQILKRLNLMPAAYPSYQKYINGVTISSIDRNALLEFFEMEAKPLHVIKSSLGPDNSPSQEFIYNELKMLEEIGLTFNSK